MRDRYLVWIDDTEHLLRSLFSDFEIGALHTERFWHLRSLGLDTARPWELIRTEIFVQAERLEQIASELEAQAARAMRAPGLIAIPDTNVFLHFQLFDRIPWTDVVGSTPVRLVVPIRVVEELDIKTASRRRDLADRARGVLKRLESLVGPSAGDPVTVAKDVSVEILVETRSVSRPSFWADNDILDTAEFLSFLTGDEVVVVSGDVSMRLRAAVRGLSARPMPDDFRAQLDGPN